MSTENITQAFENPTLREAVCEIRYDLPAASDWGKRMPSGLLSTLEKDYPLFDVIDESPFKFAVDGNVVTETIHRFRFSSDEHPYIITVKKDAFALSLKPNKEKQYEWEEYYKKLCKEWSRISDILKLENIKE